MRPRDPRYNAIPLPEAPQRRRDRRLCRHAFADQRHVRALRERGAYQTRRHGQEQHDVLQPVGHHPREQPADILERHEPVTLVPMLIMQGALDDNVLPAVQKKFAETYKAAGGDIQYQLFEGCEHEWVAKDGPQTDRAREMVKAFIARQFKSGRT